MKNAEKEEIEKKILDGETELCWKLSERDSDGYILKEYFIEAKNSTKETEEVIENLIPLTSGNISSQVQKKYTPLDWIKKCLIRQEEKKREREEESEKRAKKTDAEIKREEEEEYFAEHGVEMFDDLG